MNRFLPAQSPHLTRHDALTAVAIFLVAWFVLWHSPVTTVGDSKYTLLLTQTLLSKGSFVLDGYGLPRNPLITVGDTSLDGADYQLQIFHDHFYYYFPPGSSILSAPFVVLADALGYSPVGPGHTYDVEHEQTVQRAIASFLMAVLAVVFYLTGRQWLPPGWSGFLALGGILGTQVLSTASRALWTHTWGIALLGYALSLLAARETGRRRLHPILLATVLSWSYFVRPTNSVFIIGITVYVFLYYRELIVPYAVTGAAWFAAFIFYAWTHFGTLLPSYYQANRLQTDQFWEAVSGNLVSPSRGSFVYVPVALFVIYLVARYWRQQPSRPLVWLTMVVSALHLAAVSCFVPWYGGGCYGPRYTAELVPWFVLLAILGTRAALSAQADVRTQQSAFAWNATLSAGGVLLLLSVFVNWRGANAIATDQWNQHPASVDAVPSRVWDWRHPQILAGLIASPEPAVFPVLADGARVPFGNEAGQKFEWDGWSGSDPDYTWSEARWATLVFTADDPAASHLRLCFGPYLFPKRLRRQRIDIRLNDRPVASFKVDRIEPRDYDFPLPAGALQRRNVLTFRLPDAASPKGMGDGSDDRPLGIALHWLELTR